MASLLRFYSGLLKPSRASWAALHRGRTVPICTFGLYRAAVAPVFARTFSTEGEEKPRWLISREDVAKHNREGDCWIIINGKVYDVTEWVDFHPGQKAILQNAGGESTTLFNNVGHSYTAREMMKKMYIGDVHDHEKKARYTGEC